MFVFCWARQNTEVLESGFLVLQKLCS